MISYMASASFGSLSSYLDLAVAVAGTLVVRIACQDSFRTWAVPIENPGAPSLMRRVGQDSGSRWLQA